jgi:hypothetical protein
MNEDELGSIFDLSLEDGELISLIKKPLEESQNYWDNEFNLKKVREENMNLWLPKHWEGQDIYDHQEGNLYQDPKIFTSVETIISVVNARIPQPDVMPGQDTVISKKVAEDISKALYGHSDRHRLPDIFRIGIRNLLLKRVGFVKLRFDKNIGKFGDIIPEAIAPEDIVVDKDAVWGSVPRFIAQNVKDKTGEELISMFPEAKDKIYEMMGVNRRDSKGNLVAYKTQLARKRNIWEIWFLYMKDDSWDLGVAFVDDKFQHVLHKMKNPNWNYDEEEETIGNFLDFPMPPFIPMNYLNDGTSYIDLTSMVEQASALQRILDRRGFQIMENADQAGSGLVFNTMMIDKDDISQLVGSPDERIGVNGDVRSAVGRVAPPPLPSYVIEDKYDARQAIDNVFATHEVTRGEKSGNRTLGQDEMQREQNYTRMDDIARAVERTATYYYRYLVQMMKVFYTEEHYFKMLGEDGQFDNVMMRNDLIEDGVDIKVEAGSTMPVNKGQQMANVEVLAQYQMVDPLSIYEVMVGGQLPTPKKMLERYMLYTMDPMTYMQKTKEDVYSREAQMDIQVLNTGKAPKLRSEYNDVYLKFMNNYMMSGDFEKQPDLVKRIYVEFMRVVQMQANKQLMAMMTQAPTQEDMQSTNQQAVEQAQMEQMMQGGAGQQAEQMQQGAEKVQQQASKPQGQ